MSHLLNSPQHWRAMFPHPKADGNKYNRGHAVMVGGSWQTTGATKIAAHAALRIGAGLVSVACDTQSLPIYANSFQAIMTKLVESKQDFSALLSDKRITAVGIGPAAGLTDRTRDFTRTLLKEGKAAVLDADALTVFAETPQSLFDAIHAPCILTPHEGEFARLFGKQINMQADRISRAQQAAKLSNAIVVLKGGETIIAAPDGQVRVNHNTSPYLATAGSGDALTGFCLGLLAQHMPAFEAACAAVWLHGEAGRTLGAGLISEDLANQLPSILKQL